MPVSASTLALVAGFALGQAAVEPYSVTVNGNASKIKVGHDQDSLILPLALPVTTDREEWLRDEKDHKLEVKMSSIKRKVRGDTDCYYCSATGSAPTAEAPRSSKLVVLTGLLTGAATPSRCLRRPQFVLTGAATSGVADGGDNIVAGF